MLASGGLLRPPLSVLFRGVSQTVDRESQYAVLLNDKVPSSGRRIGKPVQDRHCPRNGNGVAAGATKTTGVEELWEGVAPCVHEDSTEVRKPAL